MKRNTNIKLLSGTWVLSLILLLAGCTDPFMEESNLNKDKATINLNLNVPGAFTGNTNSGTRAMSDANETYIDYANLQVLVFEEITPGNEVFRYKADITKTNAPDITLLVPKSRNGEKYRFVLLANAPAHSIADGTQKESALNQFISDCEGKWNANGNASRAIPMWGEYGTTFAIEKDRYISILMHRMLARVDVNVDAAVDNFKIKSIRVYRTKNKAYVATSNARMGENGDPNEVTKPHIPTSAKYNSNTPGTSYDDSKDADEDPLVYSINITGGSDSYTREIYIPESATYDSDPVIGKMDEVPCLVIGGYYGNQNTTEETFYRADFAEYENGKVKAYKQILRNHRYAFTVKSVNNHGFNKPEEALNAIPVDMTLEVQEWNEVNLGFYSQGDYFYSIQSRDVELEARTQDLNVMPSKAITYKTNLKLDGNNVSYEWESNGNTESDKFKVEFSYNGTITFTAKQNNIGQSGQPAVELEDKLILTVENMEITIRVKQKAVNVEYTLLCDKIKVHGKYREGIPLNYTHYLEVQIESVENLYSTGTEIEIVSEQRKGIYFEYKGKVESAGTLNNGKYIFTIKLQGYGTPTKDPNDRLKPDTGDLLTSIEELRINTNSITGSYCEETRIIFGYKTKKILAIGANAMYRYGYMLEPHTGSRAFVDASINFGIDPNSTVTMEQNEENNAFTIEYMTAGRGMSGERINLTALKNHMATFKPDIILTGQAIWFQDEDIKVIADFVEKGGVLLMFNEYYPRASSINAMASAIVGATLSGDNEAVSQSQFLFKLPGTKGSADQWEEDPILNGPFGDLRGLSWGIDGYFIHGFSGLPASGITTYNKRPGDNYPCFFRYDGENDSNRRAFVFIGDGGFLSNSRRYIGATYTGMYDYCPFAINTAYQPIARTNFLRNNTSNAEGYVYNSQLFGNILTWAVDYAEQYGINKDQ